eukprot:gene10973-3680_t
MTRVHYKEFEGKNRILCCGYMILGPDLRFFLISVFLIFIPSVIFPVHVGYFYYVTTPLYISIPIWVLSGSASILVYTFLCITSFMDPGILPRTPDLTEDNSTDSRCIPHAQETVLVNGKPTVLKYCFTCQIYRPPRSSHCSICDNCVENFDHHCPWTGTCIGKRNYRFFFTFVSLCAFSCFVGSLLCLGQIVMITVHNITVLNYPVWEGILWSLMYSIAPVFLICFFMVTGGFTGLLFFFHFYLISKNLTTYEQIKKHKNSESRGLLYNWCVKFCKFKPNDS